MSVITRYAPSPTGNAHVGTAIYGLANLIYARQKGGKVIMRSEDTDPVRSKREYEDSIREDLAWLGIEPDEFYRQSERNDIYQSYIKKMIDSGHAYVSKEEVKKEGDRPEVIRFKNPNKKITFTDMARGEIEIDTTDLGDFVIARDMESPLYHLTVVVDDHEMGVTHIIRGEDGLSNTPRQILIQEAIGATRPIYCHYPFLLGNDKKKLGKRHGAKSVGEYRELGYLPEAFINFLILLIWHPSNDDQEIFSLTELIEKFELERVGKGAAIFDMDKLDWLNKEYIKKLPEEEQLKNIEPYVPDSLKEKLPTLLPLLIERISKWSDVPEMIGELSFVAEVPDVSQKLLIGKSKAELPEIVEHLNKLVELLSGLSETQFDAENVKNAVWDYASEAGRGKVLWPMRVSLTGLEKSPDPFTVAALLGKEETISRLTKAIENAS